ncbi:uncharacterized protein LOC34620962 [Cyclospora cayetanensis]|uniref:Uncharacterized protein LOC34620962 n=1 Tax=Cyclospora cayetanensis TaxID=88456 RepID=A0A6P6RV43_9EIME|nr:uncharacterized protein LOC34620962 [Cyclospora cayetanensis]
MEGPRPGGPILEGPPVEAPLPRGLLPTEERKALNKECSAILDKTRRFWISLALMDAQLFLLKPGKTPTPRVFLASRRRVRKRQDPDPFAAAARPPQHLPLPPRVGADGRQEPAQVAAACVPEVSRTPGESFRREALWGSARSEAPMQGGSEIQKPPLAAAAPETPGASAGSPSGLAEILKGHVAAQRWMQQRLWVALTKRQWPLFDRLLSNYWRCGLNYDEVTYTLKLHGYILSHRKKPEKAFLVLEEMKAAKMHPAIIRLNEGIIISQMELQDIFCALPADAYQNLCRLAFHSAIKVQRQRRIRLRERLMATSPEQLFALTYRDVVALLDAQEKALCFPDETLALIDADRWNDAPSLEGNQAFLAALNEALGLEAPGSPEASGALEDSEDPGESLAGIESPVGELNLPDWLGKEELLDFSLPDSSEELRALEDSAVVHAHAKAGTEEPAKCVSNTVTPRGCAPRQGALDTNGTEMPSSAAGHSHIAPRSEKTPAAGALSDLRLLSQPLEISANPRPIDWPCTPRMAFQGKSQGQGGRGSKKNRRNP